MRQTTSYSPTRRFPIGGRGTLIWKLLEIMYPYDLQTVSLLSRILINRRCHLLILLNTWYKWDKARNFKYMEGHIYTRWKTFKKKPWMFTVVWIELCGRKAVAEHDRTLHQEFYIRANLVGFEEISIALLSCLFCFFASLFFCFICEFCQIYIGFVFEMPDFSLNSNLHSSFFLYLSGH